MASSWYEGRAKTFENPPPDPKRAVACSGSVTVPSVGSIWVEPTEVMKGQPAGKVGEKRPDVPEFGWPVVGSMHVPSPPETPPSPEEKRNVVPRSPSFMYSRHCRCS